MDAPPVEVSVQESVELPFRPAKPPIRPLSRDEMTDEVFNARMAEGLAQAKANQTAPMEDVFARLLGEIDNGKAI